MAIAYIYGTDGDSYILVAALQEPSALLPYIFLHVGVTAIPDVLQRRVPECDEAKGREDPPNDSADDGGVSFTIWRVPVIGHSRGLKACLLPCIR